MTGLIGIITALTSTLSWAIGTIHLKKITNSASPIAMTLIKSLYGGLLLILIALITKENLIINQNSLLLIIYSGIIGIAIGDSLFFASLKHLSPIVLSIILLAGPDIITGILSFIILKEFPTPLVWIGIFLIIFGLYFLIFPIKNNNNEKQKSNIKGYILALLSLLCTAIAMIIIKPILYKIPTITVTAYRLLFGGICILIYSLFNKKIKNHLKPFKEKTFRNTFLSIISLVAIGGFWLSIVSIKHIDLITASTLMSLEPLFIIIIMILFSKYKPQKRELLGSLITIIGIIFIIWGEVSL